MDEDIFGSLRLISEKKDAAREYKLYFGRHSVGCSINANIRLLLKNFTESILCVIDVNEKGYSTLVKQSFRVPILVNYKQVKGPQVLKHNDKIQIASKQFVYVNNNIQEKDIINEEKSIINSKTKRQTTFASLSHKSTSRIPVKQSSMNLRLSSSTSKIVQPIKAKNLKVVKKRLSLGNDPIEKPISTRNIQLDDNDKMDWEKNLPKTPSKSKTPSKQASSMQRMSRSSIRTPKPSILPTISEIHQVEKDINVENSKEQQTTSNSGGSTSFIVEDLMVFSVNAREKSTSNNKNNTEAIEDQSMITFCTPENNTSTVILENNNFESEKVTRKSKTSNKSISLEVSTPKSILVSKKSKKRARESSATVERTIKKIKTSASIFYVNKNLSFNKSDDYSNVDIVHSPVLSPKPCRSMSEPRKMNRRYSRRLSLVTNKFSFKSSDLINNDSMEGVDVLNESKDETTCLTTESFYGSHKKIKESSHFRRLSKCMTEPRKNRRCSMRRKSLVPIKFNLDAKDDDADSDLTHFESNITKRKKMVNSTPTIVRRLTEKSRQSVSSEESFSLLNEFSDDEDDRDIKSENVKSQKPERSRLSSVKSGKSIDEYIEEYNESLQNDKTFDIVNQSLKSRRSSVKSRNSMSESHQNHNDLSEIDDSFNEKEDEQEKNRRSSMDKSSNLLSGSFNENVVSDDIKSNKRKRGRPSKKSAGDLNDSSTVTKLNSSNLRSSTKSNKSDVFEDHNETLELNQKKTILRSRKSLKSNETDNETINDSVFNSDSVNSTTSCNKSDDDISTYFNNMKENSLPKFLSKSMVESKHYYPIRKSSKSLGAVKLNLFENPHSTKLSELNKKQQKSPKNDLTKIRTLRSLFSPNVVVSPVNDLRNVPNLRKFFSPQFNKSPKNDLTNIKGLKPLFLSPKQVKSPKNDLTDIKGVKKLMSTPKPVKSPKNDLTDIKGVKKLMSSPKPVKSPKNDLTNVKGLRNLFNTPKEIKSPKNDLTNISGLKPLFNRLKEVKSPNNDLRHIKGVKTLMATPKPVKSPKNDLSDVKGLRNLLNTPKEIKSPKNDLLNVCGVKRLLKTPKQNKLPKNDLTDIPTLRYLFNAEKRVQNSPVNNFLDVSGVKQLFGDKKKVHFEENNEEEVEVKRNTRKRKIVVEENKINDPPKRATRRGKKELQETDVQINKENEENNELVKPNKRNTRRNKRIDVDESPAVQEITTKQTIAEENDDYSKCKTRQKKAIIEENKITDSPKRATRRGRKGVQDSDVQNKIENDADVEVEKPKRITRKGKKVEIEKESPTIQENNQTNDEELEGLKRTTKQKKVVEKSNKITDSPKRATRRVRKGAQDSDVQNKIENDANVEVEKPKRITRRGKKVEIEKESPTIQGNNQTNDEELEGLKRKTKQKKVVEESNEITDSPKRATRRGKKVEEKSPVVQETHTKQTNEEHIEDITKVDSPKRTKRTKKVVEESENAVNAELVKPKRIVRKGKKNEMENAENIEPLRRSKRKCVQIQ